MRPRRSFLLPLLAFAAFAILIGLGTWQLQRLGWKEDLIARVETRVAESPVRLPPSAEWASLDLDAWEYRPVEMAGNYRNDLEARVYTLLTEGRGPLEGPGYWIMTPFEIEGGGGTVIVNRGFVPLDRADAVPRAEVQTVVRGLVRGPEGRNMFTPQDQPQSRLYYARDPAPIAQALGLPQAAPFTVDAQGTPPGGLPQAGETRLTFPNRHLEYALTWYGLAGALVAVFAAFTLSRRRRLA